MTKKIRKYITALAVFATLATASAQVPSPELLKDKTLFAKTELFDSPVVFADRNANAEAVRAYEASAASYKPEELMPVAICYMGLGDFKKAKSLFETFLSVRPDNVRALRTLGTVSMLSRDFDSAKSTTKKPTNWATNLRQSTFRPSA